MKLTINNNMGREPLLLAHFFPDKSHVAIGSILGGLVLGSFVGPLGFVLAAWAAYNDLIYAEALEKGTLPGRDPLLLEGAEGLATVSEPTKPAVSAPVQVPVMSVPTIGDVVFPELPEVPLVTRQTMPQVERRATPREPVVVKTLGQLETATEAVPEIVTATETMPAAKLSGAPLDSVLDMGQNPQSAIIGGVPGAGKGVFVSNAGWELKRSNSHVHIFVIDAKNDRKETGYWSFADTLWRKDFDACSTEEAAIWYMDRVNEFRRHQGPKLLISDEGTMVLTVLRLAKVFEEIELGDGKITRSKIDLLGEFKKFLVAVSGMGDSRDAWIWIICQVINCEDLGITGGVRSMFRSIALVSPKNRNAVNTFFATGFVPLPRGGKTALYELMESSPCGRAYYDGKTDQWLPTPLWQNHSGYDRDTRTHLSQGSLISPNPWVEPEEAIVSPTSTAALHLNPLLPLEVQQKEP